MIENDDSNNDLMLPLSPVQQGMFFHYIHKRNKDYLEQMICDIVGELDLDLFERTINKLIELHDSLRTIFLYKGVGKMQQVILDHKLVHLDFRDISKEVDPQKYLAQCISLEADKNFVLSKETYRCKLFKLAEANYVFLCTYHHLILDSWTIRLLEEGFCKVYYHEKENLAYDNNERYSYQLYLDWIEAQDQEKAKKYWANYLKQYSGMNNPELPKLNTVRRRKIIDLVFEPGVRKLIDEIGNAYKTTINSVIMAAWGIYVLDHYQKNEIIFGCVTVGRMIGLKNVDKIAGLFVNSIPLYITRSSSLKALITNLQKDIFMAANYSYLSLSDIMACGNLRTGHICTFLNFSIDAEEINNDYSQKLPFRIKNIRYNEQANYDVYLDVYLKEGDFRMKIYYDMDNCYFDESEITNKVTRILEHFGAQPEMLVRDMLNNLMINEKMGNEASFDF